MQNRKKDKIINDPIYGFVKLDKGIITDLIDHPYFQRLRKISQLGLSYLVYPGAHHTRFHHAIGCMFLMNKAINQIRDKGHEITEAEAEALKIAILLHDIGHGPFSHALEHSIASNVSHEQLSSLFMQRLNEQFEGKLSLAIKIFNGKYPKQFLHQLVSSQLDMDRLDYLKRDSFFSGVTEGNIGTERIINMLDVVNDNLVVEEKGIYSIEKFLIARRLMYWQVYLHKTVISAENMLKKVLQRAKDLITAGKEVYAPASLSVFLNNYYTLNDFDTNPELLNYFAELDDFDIYASLKYWKNNPDFVLSSLSDMILNRKLLKIKIQNTIFNTSEIENELEKIQQQFNISKQEARYFVFSDKVSNSTYNNEKANINILMKNGDIIDITAASDHFNIEALNKTVNKYFLCYPKLK
ncbi:MAG TPA: HD domain-containing protein [Flavobacteriales bacterium]|nr:HD domain-containing protein [Flavobacteriales bacterium]